MGVKIEVRQASALVISIISLALVLAGCESNSGLDSSGGNTDGGAGGNWAYSEQYSGASENGEDWDNGDSIEDNYNYRNIIESGEINGVSWELYDTGELEFNGEGDLAVDFEMPNDPDDVDKVKTLTFITEPLDAITSISVSEGIESLGDFSFANLKKLESISLPSTLKSIGSYAFNNTGLTSIEIPDTVTSIGKGAFRSCTLLESIKLSSNLSGISDSMFKGCKSLKAIEIPETVISIESQAFMYCKALESVDLMSISNLRVIDSEAFYECEGLQEVTVPNVEFGDGIFESCHGVKEVTLADGITAIPKQMFNGCKDLRYIAWPISLKEIGDGAFGACTSIGSITFPASLEAIGKQSFMDCSKLTKIELNEGLLTIKEQAFACCDLLEVTLPSTLEYVGLKAFRDNRNLSKVVILPTEFIHDAEHPKNFDAQLFWNCPVKNISKYKALSIPDGMFLKANNYYITNIDE